MRPTVGAVLLHIYTIVLTGPGPNPIATTIGTYTKCDPRSNLPTFKSHGKNPKVWKMGTAPTGEVGPSTPRPNPFGRKTMLCVWWDQCGVVYFE